LAGGGAIVTEAMEIGGVCGEMFSGSTSVMMKALLGSKFQLRFHMFLDL